MWQLSPCPVASWAVTHDSKACGKPPRRILFDASIANMRQGCMHELSAATSPAMSVLGFLYCTSAWLVVCCIILEWLILFRNSYGFELKEESVLCQDPRRWLIGRLSTRLHFGRTGTHQRIAILPWLKHQTSHGSSRIGTIFCGLNKPLCDSQYRVLPLRDMHSRPIRVFLLETQDPFSPPWGSRLDVSTIPCIIAKR